MGQQSFRHPVTGADGVVLEAGRRLGDQVVEGRVTPQRWTVSDRIVSAPAPTSGSGEHIMLTAAQVLELARTGRRIEAELVGAQDVEWAMADEVFWVVQARPITTTDPLRSRPASDSGAPDAAGEVLMTGTASSPGRAAGPTRVISGLDNFHRFRSGDVLVCRTTSPAWTPLLARAAAVVTEVGGILSHAAIVAREFGIPAGNTAVSNATKALSNGQHVMVDGTHGTVSTVTPGDGQGVPEEEQ